MSDETLSNLCNEERRFEPPAELAEHANVTAEAYARADDGPRGVLGRAGRPARLGPEVGPGPRLGQPAVREVVRRRQASTRRTTAWTGTSRPATATRWPSTGSVSPRTTPATSPTPSCQDEVCQAANALDRARASQTGDRVAIYMPMIPETVVAMLACARLGAPHTVVFGGFSADALATRVADCEREGRHHRRRRLPARRRLRAQARRRRGLRQGGRERPRRARRCSSSGVPARTWSGTTSRDVWWHDVVDQRLGRARPPSASTPSTRST